MKVDEDNLDYASYNGYQTPLEVGYYKILTITNKQVKTT